MANSAPPYGTEAIRVAHQTPDPITKAGLTAALQRFPDLALSAAPDDDEADVLLLIADRLTHPHTDQLRRRAGRTGAPVVLISADPAELELMTVVACRIVVTLPRAAATPERIHSGIVTATSGGALVSPKLLRELLGRLEALHRNTALRAPGSPTLTPRETEALRLTAEGFSTVEIAERLKYSERTVKGIMHDLVQRLAVRNRSHAVAYGIRHGLI